MRLPSVPPVFNVEGCFHFNGLVLLDNLQRLGIKLRMVPKWEERAPLYADVQKKIAADAPEIFGMLANRRWGMRDHVKGFVFSPVHFTGEVNLYPLAIV